MSYKVLAIIVDAQEDPLIEVASSVEQIGSDDLTIEEAEELLAAIAKAEANGEF